MKRFFIYSMIIALVALIVYRFIQSRETRTAITIQQIQAVSGYPVEVETTTLEPFRLVRHFTGTVTGNEETEIVPMVGEYIVAVLVKEGQKVSAGQSICELAKDNPSASIAQTKLLLENAERDLKRVEVLHSQGAVARQMLDNTTLARDLAKERFETSRRVLTITTPISGVVADLKAETGKFAVPGIALARVVSIGGLRVKVDLPSTDREIIRAGMEAFVNTSGKKIPAVVRQVGLAAERDSRTFTAWIDIKGDEQYPSTLSSGLMVDVDVIVVDIPAAVTVSDDAVLKSSGERWLFAVDNGRAVRRNVVIGGSSNGRTWITSGIDAGVQAVAVGANALSDNAKIRIISN